MKAWQHVYPQTRTYHFLDGSQRRFENVQDVVMGTFEHIWLPGDIVVNINPRNVKYTVCEAKHDALERVGPNSPHGGTTEDLRERGRLIAHEYALLKKLGIIKEEEHDS